MPWTFVAPLSALAGREIIGAVCHGQRLALYRLNDGYFATSDSCPHQGAAVSEGCVVDGLVECPRHFALFDIRTGAADGGVTTTGLRTFATKVVNDEIHVDLDA